MCGRVGGHSVLCPGQNEGSYLRYQTTEELPPGLQNREDISKRSNPKDAVGTKKVPLSTVSAPVMAELGLALLEGGRKYGRHNYRVVGVRASVYYDAAMRHLMAWWEGEDIDPDSGMHHTVKAMASLMVARDAEINGKITDDRPPKCPEGWVSYLNQSAAEIVDQYPDAKDPYTEEDHGTPAK